MVPVEQSAGENGRLPKRLKVESPSAEHDIAAVDASPRPSAKKRRFSDTHRRGPQIFALGIPRIRKTKHVGNWVRLNPISEGTYGTVYRAAHREHGDVVALKKFKDPEMKRPQDTFETTALREVLILKQCVHRNIVAYRDVVEEPLREYPDYVRTYLVMDFVEHELGSLLRDGMTVPFFPAERKTIMQQLLSGVAYLHRNCIMHRDLKTCNLLFTNRGCLKIADFGMARVVSDPPPANMSTHIVTLWYRAPELLLGAKSYDFGIDMWSVGCIFAEVLRRGDAFMAGDNETTQLAVVIKRLGRPTTVTWPGLVKLKHADYVLQPRSRSEICGEPANPVFKKLAGQTSVDAVRDAFANFADSTDAMFDLMGRLLAFDPARRPSAEAALAHEWFTELPTPKPESMMPTFPSRAGQERPRRADDMAAPSRPGYETDSSPSSYDSPRGD